MSTPQIIIEKQVITRTLEENYMPYAMSVIISRAIPEIDGFKPSHRKLLYTMYNMGLLTGKKTKSANIVGQTMKLNPHGDAAIYETMVRMTRGYEALLHPYVDSKGSFGKHYSRDTSYAASRYTEAKLDQSTTLLFDDIDKDTVDFVDSYDGGMKEPTLLPSKYPNILVNSNMGIAVGMASNICSFNLRELCETTIELIRDENHRVFATLSAPDFPTGGELIYNERALNEIIDTGRGSFKIRSVYSYDKKSNCIDITQIPYSTTAEAIIDKIVDLVKLGKIKEISDIRDETDLSGLKITIDLKRGVDADKLMNRLFKMTPLEDTFSCNFNILIAGSPRVMGVKEILTEWIAFRTECVKRKVYFELKKKQARLHLLNGLKKILLDIDKAIKIIRETENDKEVVPNLMIGFLIDEIQGEYIAEIKLRNLNKNYILNALKDVEKLKAEIEDLNDTLKTKGRIGKIIISELKEVSKKYGKDRVTKIIYEEDIEVIEPEEEISDYAVNVFVTKEGYFKKITPISLRMGGEQKLKEGDEIVQQLECTNRHHLLVFTNQQQVYKARLSDFDDQKASVLGDFLPAKLAMDDNESVVATVLTSDYSGSVMFFFENGRVSKIPLKEYETKTNRKKLQNAYCAKFPICKIFDVKTEGEFLLTASSGRMLLVNSLAVPEKTTKSSQGIIAMTLKGKNFLSNVERKEETLVPNAGAYKSRSLPSPGYPPKKGEDKEECAAEQLIIE